MLNRVDRGSCRAIASIIDGETSVAAAGRDADVAVWSLEQNSSAADGSKAQPVWRARNLANDNLDLQVPIWTTDFQFVPTEPQLVMSTTGFGKDALSKFSHIKAALLTNCT